MLIKHSAANNDALLFKDSILASLPTLHECFNEPDGRHSKTFGTMTVTQFKSWRDKELSASKTRAIKGKGKDNVRRMANSSSGSGKRYVEIDVSEEDRPGKRARSQSYGGGSSKRYSSPIMSDDIDNFDNELSD